MHRHWDLIHDAHVLHASQKPIVFVPLVMQKVIHMNLIHHLKQYRAWLENEELKIGRDLKNLKLADEYAQSPHSFL
jgi:hypothetical protein